MPTFNMTFAKPVESFICPECESEFVIHLVIRQTEEDDPYGKWEWYQEWSNEEGKQPFCPNCGTKLEDK